MPSVMVTIKGIPASMDSMMASPQNAGGTNTMAALASVSLTAFATVLNTGIPSTFWPPLPGVTPATTLVP